MQEQNELKKLYMHEHAVGFRNSPEEYEWLQEALVRNDISVDNGILVSLNSCIDQGPVEECNAIWVTSDKQFYELDVVLKYGTQEIEEIEGFSEITGSININSHQPGRGKTLGVLALELVEELL